MCCIVLKTLYLCVIKVRKQQLKQLKHFIMKRQSTTLFINLSENDVKNLTTVVAETLATNLLQEKQKVFSAAELWNIQRQKKAVRSSRRLF